MEMRNGLLTLDVSKCVVTDMLLFLGSEKGHEEEQLGQGTDLPPSVVEAEVCWNA